jgi:hypothetical protein
LNDIPINSFEEWTKWEIQHDQSAPPVIASGVLHDKTEEPVPGPFMYAAFDLGKIFTETRFAQSMTIQQNETTGSYANARLVLNDPYIVIDSTVYTFMVETYLKFLCGGARRFEPEGSINFSMYVCPSSNRIIAGVPTLELVSKFAQ